MNADLMKWIGAMLAGAGWFALIVLGKANAGEFVTFVQFTLVGLGAHGMTKSGVLDTVLPPKVGAPPPPAIVVTKESGRVEPWLLLVIACVILVCLSACAAIPANVVAAKKGSDDNAVENLKLLFCDLPVGAVLRHAEISSAVRSFCLPAPNAGDVLGSGK